MKKIIIIILITITILFLCLLYIFNYIPHRKYTNSDFGIDTYISKIDKDNDNVDDQTDILNNAKAYIQTKPKYKSKYYSTGYPDDEYGVCTDVVSYALRESGYILLCQSIKCYAKDCALGYFLLSPVANPVQPFSATF